MVQFRTDIEQAQSQLGELERQYDKLELACLNTTGTTDKAGDVPWTCDSKCTEPDSTPLEPTSAGVLERLENKKKFIQAKRQDILELYQKRTKVSRTFNLCMI